MRGRVVGRAHPSKRQSLEGDELPDQVRQCGGRPPGYSVAMIWAHTATMPRNRASDASVAASAIITRITVSLRYDKKQYTNYVLLSFFCQDGCRRGSASL